jgi:cytochrome c nitrite reductase small subunit
MGISRRAVIGLAVLVGVLGGVGGYTAHYAHALSYMSSDPEVCVNCHIMRPQYESWQRSSHHAVARCVDCHLPDDFVGKYLAKAENGYHHGKGFTFQDFHEPIRIKGKNARILQDNCTRCHADLVHGLAPGADDAPSCVHCHASVGHGDVAGLGGPERSVEHELQRMRSEE